jgi:hypothetical protein
VQKVTTERGPIRQEAVHGARHCRVLESSKAGTIQPADSIDGTSGPRARDDSSRSHSCWLALMSSDSLLLGTRLEDAPSRRGAGHVRKMMDRSPGLRAGRAALRDDERCLQSVSPAPGSRELLGWKAGSGVPAAGHGQALRGRFGAVRFELFAGSLARGGARVRRRRGAWVLCSKCSNDDRSA